MDLSYEAYQKSKLTPGNIPTEQTQPTSQIDLSYNAFQKAKSGITETSVTQPEKPKGLLEQIGGYIGQKVGEIGQGIIKPFTQNPVKTYQDILSSVQQSSAQMGANLGTSVRKYADTLFTNMDKTTPAEKIGASFDLITNSLGAVFSPISTTFEIANQLPAINAVTQPIGLIFDATGKVGKFAFGGILDRLPIDQKSKDILKAPVESLGELTGQMTLGAYTLGKLQDTFLKKGKITEQDAKIIAKDAKKESETAKQMAMRGGQELPKSEPIKNLSYETFKQNEVSIPQEAPKSVAQPEIQGNITPKLEKEVRFYIKKDVPITRDMININDIRGRGLKTGEISSGKEDLSKPVIVAKQSDGTYQLLDGRHRLDVLEKQGVKNIDAIIGDKTLQPLAQEARKYKSAEDFVNSKYVKVYHATNTDLTKITDKGFNKGTWFATKKEGLETFGKNIIESYVKKEDLIPSSTTKINTKTGQLLFKGESFVSDKEVKILTRSQLTDFYNQAVGEIKPEVKPQELTYEPTTAKSGLAESVRSKAIRDKMIYGFDKRFKDLPEYDRNITSEKATKSTDFVLNNPEEGFKIAMGEKPAPDGLFPEDIYVAMDEYATQTGNVEMIRQLATESSLISEATQMGQRIQTLSRLNPDSALSKLQEIKKARDQRVERVTRKTNKDIANSLKEGEKGTNLSKEDLSWNKFLLEIKC